MWMATVPINLVVSAEYSRINVKYGETGIRYALIGAGQSLFLYLFYKIPEDDRFFRYHISSPAALRFPAYTGADVIARRPAR
jgi:hypothetical protein